MTNVLNHYQCPACDEMWSRRGPALSTDACPNHCVLFLGADSYTDPDEEENEDANQQDDR
jgi:hypothetical protein